MTRIDLLVLKRIGGRICLTVAVFFGLICLIESLNTYRFGHLSAARGTQYAVLAIVIAAVRWSIKGLTLTVLLGSMIGLTDLAQRRELTIIHATGQSVWRVLRAPALAVAISGLLIAMVGEPFSTAINRTLSPTRVHGSGALTASGAFWLQQGAAPNRYVISALHADETELKLNDVTVFYVDDPGGRRLIAPEAELTAKGWAIPRANLVRPDLPMEALVNITLPASITGADLRLKLRSTEDFTFFELGAFLTHKLNDPRLRAAAATRFLRLLTMPVLLVGVLFIAFAFSAGYRRQAGYGVTLLYGILSGFVVFVITELADRAGAADALDPTLAALGPGVVALVIGATVLLFKEDGRV